jgi:hypothetical protein
MSEWSKVEKDYFRSLIALGETASRLLRASQPGKVRALLKLFAAAVDRKSRAARKVVRQKRKRRG